MQCQAQQAVGLCGMSQQSIEGVTGHNSIPVRAIETKTHVSAFGKKDSAFNKELYLRHTSR